MVDELAALVECESPSGDLAALVTAADVVADLGALHLCERPERVAVDGRTHLRWRFSAAAKVVVVGHLDTVWPVGTLSGWPFDVIDGRASGPGAFDMKAGLVQGFNALATIDDLDGVAVLVTADEEIGSPTSRRLVEETAAGADAALVLEPSAAGALKTARKGVSVYDLVIRGREAHVGLQPERGVNALVELAHQLLRLERIASRSDGTTVTPTVATAGSTANTVPAQAEVRIDVRAPSADEQSRVDGELRALRPALHGACVEVRGGPNRPPLPPSASAGLYARAQDLATRLGLAPLTSAVVGGGSDGNFTAAVGVPTLDGLGAVGDGAHARGEYVEVNAMPTRAALVAALAADLLGRPR